jgi:hypothetical protein
VWKTPVPCVRAAGHVLYGNFHEKYALDADTVAGVKMQGLEPAGWDGALVTDYDNWTMAGGGLECATEKLTLTGEVSTWRSTLKFNPMLEAPTSFREIRGYAQANYRVTDRLSASLYTSVFMNRTGGADSSEASNHQYDTAVSVRYDVTPELLVKGEAHVIDGFGATEGSLNRGSERVSRWGMFLLKTTVTF